MKLKLRILIFLTCTFLSVLFIGCGVIMSGGEYKVPDLPKSELATIKVDTDSGWLQYDLIVLRIDGKLAVSKNIEDHQRITIDKILVTPGKHDMSLLVGYKSFQEDTPRNYQIVSRFSADVEAGSTYLLTADFSRDADGDFNLDGKLIDKNKNKIVSESKLFGQFTSDLE